MDRLAHLDQGLKVAVIGGGWAGLTTAVELAAKGMNVTVFEAARRLGGRARSVEINGLHLDNGQHILIGAYRETLRLMEKVGRNPEELLHRLPLELNHPAGGFLLKLPRLPAPFNLALGLLRAKGLSLREKLSAARFMRSLQSAGYRLDNDCSVAALLDRHRQSGHLRRFMWEPLCIAALNTAPAHASARIFANVLRDSLGGQQADTDLLLPHSDLSRIFPDAAGQFIEKSGGRIRLSSRIETIGSDLTIHGEQFDHLVLAVAPQHAAGLLGQIESTAPIARQLEQYSFEPIGTVYAAYSAKVSLPCPMLGLDDGRSGRLGQWVFKRAPEGSGSANDANGNRTLLAFVLSARGAWDEQDNDALMQTLHGELEQALGKQLPRPTWHRVIRERRATFSCRPNLPRPTSRTPIRGLWLAGDYVCADYPATLEGAVRSGVSAARAILA